MTDYLERASVARGLKALLVGVASRERAAAEPAAAETRLPIDAPDFAVAGSQPPLVPA